MTEDAKTMFEIYRETGYGRAVRTIFYTELEEHAREKEIARAAAGVSVYSGFIRDEVLASAREVISAIVDELNDLEDEVVELTERQRRQLAPFVVP